MPMEGTIETACAARRPVSEDRATTTNIVAARDRDARYRDMVSPWVVAAGSLGGRNKSRALSDAELIARKSSIRTGRSTYRARPHRAKRTRRRDPPRIFAATIRARA